MHLRIIVNHKKKRTDRRAPCDRGSLSKGVLVFVILSVFTLMEKIYLKIRAHPLPKNEKRPLPAAVRRSKTLLPNLPNNFK